MTQSPRYDAQTVEAMAAWLDSQRPMTRDGFCESWTTSNCGAAMGQEWPGQSYRT